MQLQLPHHFQSRRAKQDRTYLPYVRDDATATFPGSFLDVTASASDRIESTDDGVHQRDVPVIHQHMLESK